MANYFPCPNPACTYQFDADQLPAAAMVTCPVCRTRFPYRVAQQQQQQSADDEGGDDDWNRPSRSSERDRPNRLVNPRVIPKSNKTQTILMLLGFTLVVVTILLVVMNSMRKSWFGKQEQGVEYTDQNFNFRFKRFEDKWREDTNLRGDTFNGFLQKMRDEDVWIGLRCIYLGGGNGIRGPRDGELEAHINKVLSKFTGVQKEPVKANIAKQSLDGYRFTGNLDDTPVWGEIHATSYKGIGYVMAVFATESKWEESKKDLIALRDSFEFAGIRDKWKEASSSSTPLLVKGGDYELLDTTIGLWELAEPESPPDDGSPKKTVKRGSYVRDATDEDENATMVLRCMHPEHFRKARKDYLADAMVVVLPKGGETMEDIRKYVHDSLIRKEGDRKVDFTFEPMQKQPFEMAVPSNIGTFRVTNSLDKTHKRYYAMNVMKINDHVVAAVGWCRETDSDLMGPYIINLIKTLKPR